MSSVDSPDFGHTFVPIDSLTSSPRSSVGSTSVLDWNSESGSESFSARPPVHEQRPPVPRIPSQVSPNTPPMEGLSSHGQIFVSSKSAAPRVDGMVASGPPVDEHNNLLGALGGRFTLQDSVTQWQEHAYREITTNRPETPSVMEHPSDIIHDEQCNSPAPSSDRFVTTDSTVSAVTVTQPLHASSLFLPPPAPLMPHVYSASPPVMPNNNNSENISIAEYFQLKVATEEAQPVQPPVDGPPRPSSAASCLSYTSNTESPIQSPFPPPPVCVVEPQSLRETWPDFISRVGNKDSVAPTGCTKPLPRSQFPFTSPKTSSTQVCGERRRQPFLTGPPSLASQRIIPNISYKFEVNTPRLKPIKPTLPNIASLPSIPGRHPPYMTSSHDSFYGQMPKLANCPVPPSSLQGPTLYRQIPPPPVLSPKLSCNGAETRDFGQASPGSTDSTLPPPPALSPIPSRSVSGSRCQIRPSSDAGNKLQSGTPWGDIVCWPSPSPSGSPMSAYAIPPSPPQVESRSVYPHHNPPRNAPFVSPTLSPTPSLNYTQRPPRALPNPNMSKPFGTWTQAPYTPRYTGSTLPRDMHLCAGPPTWGPTPRRLRFAPLPPTPSAGVPYAGIPSSTLPYATPLPPYPSYPMPYPYQPLAPQLAPQLAPSVSPSYSSWGSGTTTNSQQWTPHPVFSYSDGSIVFRIGNVGYKVHRHFFERHSTYFRDLLAHPKYAATSPLPHVIHLWDVTKVDFERLLLIFYPSNLVDPQLFSIEEWTSILMLSNKWNFAQLKTLAVRELGYITTTTEKIALSKEYNIGNPQWLLAAYREVCTRRYPLSLLEAEKLGLETVIKVWEVQHELTIAPSTWGRSVDVVIQDKFGLY